MAIPFFDRLTFRDYQSLVAASFFLLLEGILRVIVTLLPQFIIQFFDSILKSLFPWLFRPYQSGKTKKFEEIGDFVEIVSSWGYPVESHLVTTRDHYVISLFRVQSKSGSTPRAGRPAVLIFHGFFMNCEVWVTLLNEKHNLPIILADAGFDVWVGNLRGNKYGLKHLYKKPSSQSFWEYSLDELALYDLPDTIDHILRVTGQKSLSYIGFSQGTAMAFAALSINPLLNEQINLFVALAPATTPPGLDNSWIDAVVKATPNITYLFLGRKRALSAALFWQRVLPPQLFMRLIDVSCNFLFGWTGRNIKPAQKVVSYQHLYSFTSVQAVVHWFQIIRCGRFQMFDDLPCRLPYYRAADGNSPHRFPTSQIRTPIAIYYGDSDSLVNIEDLLKNIPRPIKIQKKAGWEHLDFLWADGIENVYYDVLELVKGFIQEKELREKLNPDNTLENNN
ncbi:uncharacterized protein VTP21DRAFT_1769 [Calcarisporiella thermophila]|uniref:uncharacterized protein n=1 Tax=Calcarisporiella thermophila TaxID=911321 RepID=UPI0037422B75